MSQGRNLLDLTSLIAAVVFLVLVIGLIRAEHYRSDFEEYFLVTMELNPHSVSDSDRPVEQGIVNVKIRSMREGIDEAERESCAPSHCEAKAKEIAARKEMLQEAMRAAWYYQFTVPPPSHEFCDNGAEPVDGQCEDGSIPH